MTTKSSALTPDSILELAFGYWSSKVLLTAVKFGLFTQLGGDRRATGEELCQELELHSRANPISSTPWSR